MEFTIEFVRGVLNALGVVGGPLLAATTLTRNFRATGSHHLRVALWMAGAFTFGWGLLGLIDLSYHQHLARAPHSLLHNFKGLFGGSALGILLLEFISGEFSESRRRYREMRHQHVDRPAHSDGRPRNE